MYDSVNTHSEDRGSSNEIIHNTLWKISLLSYSISIENLNTYNPIRLEIPQAARPSASRLWAQRSRLSFYQQNISILNSNLYPESNHFFFIQIYPTYFNVLCNKSSASCRPSKTLSSASEWIKSSAFGRPATSWRAPILRLISYPLNVGTTEYSAVTSLQSFVVDSRTMEWAVRSSGASTVPGEEDRICENLIFVVTLARSWKNIYIGHI